MTEIQPTPQPEAQRPSYPEALEAKLKAGRDQRLALMKEFGLDGEIAHWTDMRQGALAGPSGKEETEYTRTVFLSTMHQREESLAEQAAEMINQGKTPDEAAQWLEKRLAALDRATRTVLNVVAVSNSANKDPQAKQTLDAQEILGSLDDAALFLVTLDLEDFVDGQTQSGDLPRVLDRITASKVKAADADENAPDQLSPDDYKYIIGLLPTIVDATQFATQLRDAETKGTPVQLDGQQVAEAFTFGAIYGQMAEFQRMHFFGALMEPTCTRRAEAVPLILALAQQGTMQPAQAEELLRKAVTQSLITQTECDGYLAQKTAWSAQAMEVQRLHQELEEGFGKRLDRNVMREMMTSGGRGKVVAALGVAWGAITALLNLAMNRGVPNEYAMLGIAAAVAGTDVLTGGRCQRALAGVIEQVSNPQKEQKEAMEREVSNRPRTVDFFVKHWASIRLALDKRRTDKKPEEYRISEIETFPNFDRASLDAALAEAPGATPEEKTINVEAHLRVLHDASLVLTGKPEKDMDRSDLSLMVVQYQKQLGLSATV